MLTILYRFSAIQKFQPMLVEVTYSLRPVYASESLEMSVQWVSLSVRRTPLGMFTHLTPLNGLSGEQ